MQRQTEADLKHTGRAAFAAIAGIAVLISIQLLPPPPTFEVQRFDDVAATDSVSSDVSVDATTANDESELLAAPSDVFEAPGDFVFEAPGESIEGVREPETGTNPNKSVTDAKPESDGGGDASASTAASLVLILAPQLSLLNQFTLADSIDDENTDPADTDNETATEEQTQQEPAPPKIERRLIGVTGDKFKLDIRQWTLLGKPEARYVFVEMYDYTCPHCRNTHRAIRGAFDRFGDDLAVIALPVPLDRKCNSAAAGSIVTRVKFPESLKSLRTSNPAVHGKTAASRASTADSGTSACRAKNSARCRKPGRSSNSGGKRTIVVDRTAH